MGGAPIHWGNINFSTNGKYLLLSTLEGPIYLFDAFKGDKLQEYTTSNNEHQFIEASFSPDDQFVLSGTNIKVVLIGTVIKNYFQAQMMVMYEFGMLYLVGTLRHGRFQNLLLHRSNGIQL